MSCFIICSLLVSGSIWCMHPAPQADAATGSSSTASSSHQAGGGEHAREFAIANRALSRAVVNAVNSICEARGREPNQMNKLIAIRNVRDGLLAQLVWRPETLTLPARFTLGTLPEDRDGLTESDLEVPEDFGSVMMGIVLQDFVPNLAEAGIFFGLGELFDSCRHGVNCTCLDGKRDFYNFIMAKAQVPLEEHDGLYTWAFAREADPNRLNRLNIAVNFPIEMVFRAKGRERLMPGSLPGANVIVFLTPPYEGSLDICPDQSKNMYQKRQKILLALLLVQTRAALSMPFNVCITRFANPLDVVESLKPIFTMVVSQMMSAVQAQNYPVHKPVPPSWIQFLEEGEPRGEARTFIESLVGAILMQIPHVRAQDIEPAQMISGMFERLLPEDWLAIIADARSKRHVSQVIDRDTEICSLPRIWSDVPVVHISELPAPRPRTDSSLHELD